MPRPSWPAYAMGIAQAVALRSEDPSRQVGAVILRPDNSIASVGYNGAPAGVDLPPAIWHSAQRHQYIIHAEVNALRWTTPRDTLGGYCCVTHHHCIECLKAIAAMGILTVFWKDAPGAKHDLSLIGAGSTVLGIRLTQLKEQNGAI